MVTENNDAVKRRIAKLRADLAELDSRFAAELRHRGFDPAQVDNLALPTMLARLARERAAKAAELEEMIAGTGKTMATEVERIQDQLARAFNGRAWHGPSVLELLADVDASRAAARPIAGVHSIWELALHICAWQKAAVRRLNGDRAELLDQEDWPPLKDRSESAWQEAIAELKKSYEQLQETIVQLDEPRLKEPIIPGMSSVYVTIHGVIQHDLYHAGQIAVLKKA